MFVLAFTQVTAKLAEDATWEGLCRAVLILAALWWSWGAYAWLTNAFDPDNRLIRLPTFATMGALLIVALAVPQAFGENALQFALAYFFVRAMHMLLFVMTSRDDPDMRRAVLRLAPVALLAPSLILVSTAFDGTTQAAFFAAAILIDYSGPYFRWDDGWSVVPHHFAERFGLIVIIALGESIVAVGAGAGDVEISFKILLVALMSIGITSALWWLYFDSHNQSTLHALSIATPAERIRMARDAFSELHYFVILGIILVSLGIKKTLEHPHDPLKEIPALGLCGGLALYVVAVVAIKLRCVRWVNWLRLAAAALLVGLYPLALKIDSYKTMLIALSVLTVLIVLETHVYRSLRATHQSHDD